MKNKLFSSAAVVAALLIVAGCSTVDGDFNENQPPQVSFVNNEADADSVVQVYDLDNYSFLFSDALIGFEEDEAVGHLPDSTDFTEVRFELIRYQYFNLNFINSISYRLEYIDGEGNVAYETGIVPEANYRLDENITRYLWIRNSEEFHWTQGSAVYIIDGQFEYRPVFSYAPIIFWSGTDVDGFVERYRFFDYAYSTQEELAAFQQLVLNDDASIDWTYTVNTQAEINLTTQLGQIQKHVVFVQAQDDQDALSEPAMRVFNRSNRAPNTPTLTFQKEGYTKVTQPEEYERHVISWTDVEDPLYVGEMEAVSPYYEVPVFNDELPNWGGVNFIITCDDPDDQALVTVPLQFRFQLHQLPEDMVDQLMNLDTLNFDEDDDIWESGVWINDTAYDELEIPLDETNVLNFTSDEEGWSDDGEISLYNIPSGFYQLTVYSRDDGLEPCALPGYMRFRVVNMQPERDVLVLNLTEDSGQLAMDYTEYLALNQEQISTALTAVKQVLTEDVDFAPVWYDGSTEDYNCRWWNKDDSYLLPFSVIAQYHTVIVLADNWHYAAIGEDRFRNPFKGLAMDYLDMGGTLFWSGHSSLTKIFGYDVTTVGTVGNEDAFAGDFLSAYMGISRAFVSYNLQFFQGRLEAFVGALHEQQGFEDLSIREGMIDALRETGSYNTLYTNTSHITLPDTAMAYVEAIGLNQNAGAEALFTYSSYTAGLAEHDTLTLFMVADSLSLPQELAGEDRVVDRDPNPSSTGCWLRIFDSHYLDMEIQEAYDAFNVNRENAWADPVQRINATVNANEPVFIYVTYQYTDNPWAVGDTVSVNLRWNPVLEMHRKPVIAFTENFDANLLGVGAFTNFRTCFSTIPLYAMEAGEYFHVTVDPETNLPVYNLGTGSRGIFSYVLYRFYLPTIQETLE